MAYVDLTSSLVPDPGAVRAVDSLLQTALATLSRSHADSVVATLAVVSNGECLVLASTDDRGRRLNRRQFELRGGVGWECAHLRRSVSLADVPTPPDLVDEFEDVGLTDAIAVPVEFDLDDEPALVVMTLWSYSGAIDLQRIDDTVEAVRALLDPAVRLAAGLRRLARARAALGVEGNVVALAVGVVMEREGCDVDEARRWIEAKVRSSGSSTETVARRIVAGPTRSVDRGAFDADGESAAT